MSKLLKCAAGGVFAVLFLIPSALSSASSLTVAPAMLRVIVSEAQPLTRSVVSLRNDSEQLSTYSLRIAAVDIAGSTLLPKDNGNSIVTKALSLRTDTIVISPKTSADIEIEARNIAGLAPGGHYAALVISPDYETEGLSLQQSVSVPIFMLKEDGAARSIAASFNKSLGSIRLWHPRITSIAIKNTGNVDVAPSGLIEVSRGQSQLQKNVLNEGSRPVFPGSSITFDVSLFSGASGITMPGRYELVAAVRSDTESEFVYITDRYWYIPLWFVVFILLSGLLIVRKRSKIKSVLYTLARKSSKHYKHNQSIHSTAALSDAFETDVARASNVDFIQDSIDHESRTSIRKTREIQEIAEEAIKVSRVSTSKKKPKTKKPKRKTTAKRRLHK